MDIEKAIKSSLGTTLPVSSGSKILNMLLMTTSASHLAEKKEVGDRENKCINKYFLKYVKIFIMK